MRQSIRSESGNFDHTLALIVFTLIVFGLVMIVSASAINSYAKFGRSDYYFWHQLGSIAVAIVGWIIAQNIHYKFWEKASVVIIILTIISLILVYIPGFGAEFGTAHSLLTVPGPIPALQPSEFAKLGLVIYLAAFFKRKGSKIRNLTDGFLPFIIVVGTISLLIALQPDYGTTMLIVIIATSVYYVSGANLVHLLAGGIMGMISVMIIVANKTYIYRRFVAFINPDIDPLGIGYHIQQSLIAVGSGGLFGYGFGNSRQKFEYLPEAQGDSIFAIISEELGFIRIILIIMAFTAIAIKGYRIAENAPDKFSKLLAIGITTWIVAQAFVNIGVVISLMPTTGVPLPFISYGGSSLLSSCIAIGILLNISKYARVPNTSNRRRNKRTRTSRRRVCVRSPPTPLCPRPDPRSCFSVCTVDGLFPLKERYFQQNTGQ